VLVDAVLPGHLGWLLPSAVVLFGWLVSLAKEQREQVTAPWVWIRASVVAFGLGVVVGGASIAVNVARYPLDWAGAWSGYHRDMVYFEALSTSVAVFGPNDSIFMSGADIRYHWFAYAWAGQLAHTAEAAPFVVLTRVLPLVALIGTAALVTAWAARLSGRISVTVLAAGLLAAGGYLGAVNGTILNFDSPSQALTAVWLMAFLATVLAYLDGVGGWAMLPVVGVLSAGMVGGKVSTGAVGVAAILLVAIIATVRRETWQRRAWLATGVAGAVAAATYLLVVAGSASAGDLLLLTLDSRASSVQGLNLDYSRLGIALGTCGLILAVMARWLGLSILVVDRAWRWRPDVVVGVGVAVAGIVPIVVLSQGVNETWFALTASAPLAVLSAVGIGQVWGRLKNRAALWASLAAGVVVMLAVSVIWGQGSLDTASARFWGPWVGYALALIAGLLVMLLLSGRRDRRQLWIGSTLTILVIAGGTARAMPAVAQIGHSAEGQVALPESTTKPLGTHSLVDSAAAPVMAAPATLLTGSPPDRTGWSSAEADAARFLSGATTESDVIVTNETTSFLVPALTRRLTYMSGAPYQGLYGSKESVVGIPDRIATSQAFVGSADPSAFSQLCAGGATWAWIALDRTPRRSWAPYATVMFQNEAVAVARLDRHMCSG
jgi:hypothetical protein